MRTALRAVAIAVGVLTLAGAVPLRPSSADPSVSANGDGTSTAVWNFTTPGDYALAGTSISGGVASLAQETTWWNSTTAADFGGPDGETNVDRATWPGDVTLATTSGASILLTLQPGAAGEDAWLDRANQFLNHGPDTTMILDGRNPQSRPVLRFDLSAVPAGAVIDDAILGLYQSAGVGLSFTASVYQVTAQWDEAQVTWDDRLTGTPWGNAGGDWDPHVIAQIPVDNAVGWRSWNITQLVDLWYRGRIPNFGMILNGPNTGGNADKTFYSSDYAVDPTLRPRLDIRYRVLGATGEYVSRVGGPGTTALWQSIAWNGTDRSLVADEFDGASLDPKWTWTNPPASYDVGTTTPGHLHVVSSTGVDILGATFTGNVLANDVVGNFTATMKFTSNPTANGQKVGLMALLSARDWYGVQKQNVAGPVNWRVRATADAVTTTRVDVASGNPIPAWIRIQRAGTTFTAYTSSDGIAWTLRDAHTPTYEYPHSVRLAFYIADGLSGTALAADVDYIRVTHDPDAVVTVQTRTGDVTPVDGTWSGWSAPYAAPSGSAIGGSSRYIAYRLGPSVVSPDHLPVIGDVNVSWFRYTPSGTVETNDFVPTDLAAWGNLTTVQALNGEAIAYEYSLDGGGLWTPVAPPADLSAVSTATGRIRFRATLSTADTLVTPTVSEIRLTYAHTLDHFFVTASAAAVAGAPFTVTVAAKDAANATIASWTGTVVLAARLLDGVTPGGGVLGTTTLAISSGGSATLATETYTRAEGIRIHASFGAAEGLSGPVVVSPGPVGRVAVSPDNATLLPFDAQAFSAAAYDAFDNPVPGLSFNWTVFGGVGTLNASTGASVLFTASPPPANGTLEAAFGALAGIAAIRVVSGVPPWIALSSPAPGAHVTGVVPIAYANSTDAVLATFEYDDGGGWMLIGSTALLSGTYLWDTTGLDFVGGGLRATVENNRTITNVTVVSPIEVDNTAPAIALGTITDDQAGSGTITVGYATDADVVRVDFSYFDGAWNAIGPDVTVDGTYVWTPSGPINGVTLRAVAIDEVNLTGTDARAGVGNYTVGTWPPSIAAIPDVHVRVGAAYVLNLTFYVSDPDTPRASLSLSVSDPANVTANPGAYPSLDILYGAAGTYPVTLWVSDGNDTAWAIVRVLASAQSPPALVVPVPGVAFDEDTMAWNALGAATTSFFWDADGDALTFTLLDDAFVRTRVNGNDTVDLWAAANWSGAETLRIRATDPTGGFAEAAFLVTVRPVNDAPVRVSAIPAAAFDEDTLAADALGGNVTLRFWDVEGDLLTITVLGGASVSSAVRSGGLVDLWAAANWSGAETLRIRATDPSGAFAEGSFVATVRPVNDAPTLAAALPAPAFDEDATAADAVAGPLTLYFADVDGDALTFTILGGAQVSSRVNPSMTLDLWAAANWSGAEAIVVRATDPSGTFAEGSLAVLVRPVNDAPVLAPIPDQAWTAGDTRSLDLAPFVSDIDSNLSDLVVTTDSPHVRVDGLVLTMTFPSDWSEAQLTITVSDGDGSDSQPLRVAIAPPWWRSWYFLPVLPFALAVVVGVFVQRARFRPAKAFLVSDDKRLIREFTLDPGCEVTFEQALGAGALDAVEKPVKVAKYHAQTVKGEALAVTLLAYGPVSPEHIEFAREMLVNIQDKFEDRVRERHAEIAAKEEAIAVKDAQLEAERQAISTRSRAITDLVETTTVARTRMAQEAQALRAQAEDLAQREARIAEDVARVDAESKEAEADRAAVAVWKTQVEDEARRTRETLDAQGKAFAEQQSALVGQIEAFEANRAQKMEFLASKEVELEAKEQRLAEKEAAIWNQSEANGRQLADLAAREEALEVEADRVDKARREAEARKAQHDEVAASLDAKAAAIREDEARKAEEYRQWHATLESQETVLREQKAAFESEATEAREAAVQRRAELEEREHALVDREAKARSDAEYAARVDEDLKRREEAARLTLDRATDLTEQADRMRAEATRATAGLEARSRAMQQESERVAAEATRRAETFKVAEAQLVGWKADLERQYAARDAKVREGEAELARKLDSLEEKASLLLSREASLSEIQERLEQEQAELQTRTADVQGREVQAQQLAQQNADEMARIREESEAAAQALAAREATLKAEQERLERESQSLQDTLGAKAADLSAREAVIGPREEDLQSRLEALDAREREVVYRETQASDQIRELSAKASELGGRAKDLDARGAQVDASAKRFAFEEEEKRKQWAQVEEALRAREDQVKTQADAASTQLQLRAADLDRRERALQESTANAEAERKVHEQLLAASTARKAEAEEAVAHAEERLAALSAQDSELVRARQAFEAERAVREEKLAARAKDLDGRTAQLEVAAKRFAIDEQEKRKQWSQAEDALRAHETQAKSQADAMSAQIQLRAVEIDRRERALQEATAKAQEERTAHEQLLAASAAKKAEAEKAAAHAEERLADLNMQESELLRTRQAFEADRAAWEPKRTEEMHQLEATRQAATEQAIQAERMLEEARKQASSAAEAAKSANARLAEAAAQEARLSERRAEVNQAEGELQAQTARMGDASRELANRELEIQAWTKERAVREEKLAARAKELEAATREIESRSSAIGAEASRLMKLESDLAASASELAEKGKAADARATGLARQEREVGSREADVRGREGTIADLERRLSERESALPARESEMKASMESLERTRAAVQADASALAEDRRAAAAARQEGDGILEAARKAKAESDAQQAELSKSMKFLQKKALEVLDQEERMRKREQAIAEKEKVVDSRSEIVEGQKEVLDRERAEMAATVEKARAEAEAMRAQLAQAEAGGQSSAAIEDARKDIENRLKIVQRKAMELLDREERLRKKEDELRAAAERLGTTL